MATCNTDIVSQAYRALQSRDLASLTALLAPDHVFEQSDQLPWGGRFFGVAGFLDFFRRLNQSLDSTPSIDTMIGAGTRVAVAGRTRGTVRASGAAFDVPFVHVFELRDGRIVHGSAMIDHAAMLAALGGEDTASSTAHRRRA